MPYPLSCTVCPDEGVGRSFLRGDVSLQAKPVRGSKPFVMLVGQDPTQSQGLLRSVLGLGKDDDPAPLRDWIIGELMQPAGLLLKDIYATNAVKCTFPANHTPSHIARDQNCKPVEILAPFFGFCRRHLISEIDMIRPRILIALGKPVHQLLVGGLKWDAPVELSRAFGNKYIVEAGEQQFNYFPCITQKTWARSVSGNGPRDEVYRQLWPQFLDLLKDEVARQRAWLPEARSAVQ